MRMRTYTAHLKSDAPLDGRGLVMVREGFSWLAFLVPALWFLFRGMGIPLVLYIAVSMAMGIAVEATGLSVLAGLVVSITFSLLIGFEANDIYRWSLAQRGYEPAGVFLAPDLASAEADVLAHGLTDRPAPEAPRPQTGEGKPDPIHDPLPGQMPSAPRPEGV